MYLATSVICQEMEYFANEVESAMHQVIHFRNLF